MTSQIYRRRLPHIYVDGAAYFLTFRLAPSQDSPLKPEERQLVVEHIGRMQPGRALAFVVMPDHVHVLYQSAPNEDLTKTLQALKGASAHTLAHTGNRRAPIWQVETFDRVIRNEDDLLETWRYIEANPVRRALAESAEEFRWSSAWAEQQRGRVLHAGEGARAPCRGARGGAKQSLGGRLPSAARMRRSPRGELVRGGNAGEGARSP